MSEILDTKFDFPQDYLALTPVDLSELEAVKNDFRAKFEKIPPDYVLFTEVINEGKYRLENIDYRELSPELIKEFSDFYLEIFRNVPYSQFLLHKDNPLDAISPQEFFEESGKKYFSLTELEGFDLPDDLFYWMEKKKNRVCFRGKIKRWKLYYSIS